MGDLEEIETGLTNLTVNNSEDDLQVENEITVYVSDETVLSCDAKILKVSLFHIIPPSILVCVECR